MMTGQGEGEYSWVDFEEKLHHATHWDDFPEKFKRLIKFVPDCPAEDDPTHHELMDQFMVKFREILGRCL